MRFSEFNNIYLASTLEQITKKVDRKASEQCNIPVMMISCGNGFILQSEKYSKDNAGQSLQKYTLLKKGELAYNHGASKTKPFGVCYVLKERDEALVPFVYHCFAITNGIPKYWNYSLNTEQMDHQLKRIVSSGARMDGLLNISYQTYMLVKVYVPTNNEQQKIADFLSLIDNRIDTQNKIIEDLELFKKGIENQYFGYHKNNEYVILGDIITQVNNKNEQNKDFEVLSVSNKYGFIPQSEQFDDHEVASANKSNYKIVKQNDFAYNPARINVGSIAMLKNNQVGIVSPMYICFRTDNNRILSSYLDYFSHSNKFNNAVLKNLEGSVRLCLSFESLSKIKIHLPSLDTQYEIVKNLDLISNKISIENKILEKLKEQKKYLLSNMFI